MRRQPIDYSTQLNNISSLRVILKYDAQTHMRTLPPLPPLPPSNQSVLLSSSSSVSPPRPVPTTMAPRFLVCRPSAGARGCLSVLVQNTQSLISATSNRSWPRQMRLPSESLCSPYYYTPEYKFFFFCLFCARKGIKQPSSLPLYLLTALASLSLTAVSPILPIYGNQAQRPA